MIDGRLTAKVGDWIVTGSMAFEVKRVTALRYYWSKSQYIEKRDIKFVGSCDDARKLSADLISARQRADERARENTEMWNRERRELIDAANKIAEETRK